MTAEPQNPEPIVGIDEPPGGPTARRRRYLLLGLFAIMAVAVAAWIVDELHETDEEAVAATTVSFLTAIAEDDAAAMCSTLTPRSRELVVDDGKLYDPAIESCEEAAAIQLEQLGELGFPADEIGDIDAERIEEHVEVDGAEASLAGEDSLIETRISFAEVDGEWGVEYEGTVSTPVARPDPDASTDEVHSAADSLCISSFADAGHHLAQANEAVADGDAATAQRELRLFVAEQRALLRGLQRFQLDPPDQALAELIAAQRDVVAASREIVDGEDFDPKPLFAANRRFVVVAERAGFEAFGCAAPVAGP